VSQELGAISTTPDVIGGSSSPDATPAATSSTATDTGTSSADVKSLQPVQGESTQQSEDPLAGLPSDDDLQALVAQKAPNAEAVFRLKSAYQPLKTQFDELTQKFEPFQSVLERFEQPEQLQESLSFRDNLIAWENDPQTGEPMPAPNVQFLQDKYPQHADYVVADLLNLPTFDPEIGRQVPRSDLILEAWAANPERRAHALKMLGGVEPSAIAPQWQPTEDELAIVRPELQDTYKQLPYEEREELKLASPDYINRVLEREKFTQQLQEEKKQNDLRVQQEQQHREQYVNQQAQQAGTSYVNEQLTSALTTFHESVVQQCNFIKPLDPANLPQGFTPEQATQMNQQIQASNKAEAAQITGLIVSLFNPQTKEYVLPLLKEIGAVDDKMLGQLDAAANAFGNNGRNFGNLSFRQKLSANGQGYQPGQDVTQMSNEAQRALKTMVGYANQIKGKLMEKRSQFFELKALGHNESLNSGGAVRPPINGQGYNPTTAPPSGNPPLGRMTRDEINRIYG
jgi:hypothetical protein